MTDETKHSPEWHKDDNGRLVCYHPGLEAGLLSSNLPDGELEANEALILAAPDLLKMLKHAVHWHDQLKAEDIARYMAVIDKAEGRSK